MDVIADSLTKIRNACMRRLPNVYVKKTKEIESILSILKNEGYILDYKDAKDVPYSILVALSYTENGESVITNLKRISKNSRRMYTGVKSIERVLNNYGISILTTSKGVMTAEHARHLGVGGEVICHVW